MSSSDVQTANTPGLDEAAAAGSFRDPSGRVFVRDGTLYRRVNAVYREAYDQLMRSGLYEALTQRGWLIPHTEVAGAIEAQDGAYKVLQPETIPFIAYPYEWCFSQLREAARTTLLIQREALRCGMSLKDASAYNIQFRGIRPILIDTLSFEPGAPRPWAAYRQFVQHFLAPLALMRYTDVRQGQLSRVHLDGVPLDLASSLLPARTRWRGSLLLHVHLHARSQRRFAEARLEARWRERRLSPQAQAGLLDSLLGAVERLQLPAARTAWSDYYATARHYGPEATEQKSRVVADFLRQTGAATVWDLGANTGVFSRIASGQGRQTVAFEMDHACVEAMYREAVREQQTHLLPLVMDLANPSPALGWHHAERLSLIQRGPADAVLALALMHHLAIANHAPFDRLAAFFADAGRHLIIEYVPKDDPMVQKLLQNREDVFSGYTAAAFEAAFGRRFAIRQAARLEGTGRTVYLMERRHAS